MLRHECPLGQRLSGCPALEQAERHCVGREDDLVAQVAAHSVTSICACQCCQGFYLFDQRWQARETLQETFEDARCVASDDLRRRACS